MGMKMKTLTNPELMMLKEITYSLALAHEDDCTCVACRTLQGDKGAWATIIQAAQYKLNAKS